MPTTRALARSRTAVAGQSPVIVARASSPAELQVTTPNVSEIPDGARGRVVIEGPFIGPLADLAFSEQVWGQQLAPRGAVVTDVFGDGLNTAVVEFRVPESGQSGQGFARAGIVIAAVGLLAAIGFALIALGWAVRQITVLFFGENDGRPLGASLGMIALVGGVAFLALSSRQSGSRRRT